VSVGRRQTGAAGRAARGGCGRRELPARGAKAGRGAHLAGARAPAAGRRWQAAEPLRRVQVAASGKASWLGFGVRVGPRQQAEPLSARRRRPAAARAARRRWRRGWRRPSPSAGCLRATRRSWTACCARWAASTCCRRPAATCCATAPACCPPVTRRPTRGLLPTACCRARAHAWTLVGRGRSVHSHTQVCSSVTPIQELLHGHCAGCAGLAMHALYVFATVVATQHEVLRCGNTCEYHACTGAVPCMCWGPDKPCRGTKVQESQRMCAGGCSTSGCVCSCAAGRNIHALDPYRMPSPAALARGTAVADAILDAHRAANAGAWPETLAARPGWALFPALRCGIMCPTRCTKGQHSPLSVTSAWHRVASRSSEVQRWLALAAMARASPRSARFAQPPLLQRASVQSMFDEPCPYIHVMQPISQCTDPCAPCASTRCCV